MREEKRLNNLVALSQSLLLSLSRIATRRGPYTRSPRTTHDAIGPPHRHPLDESVCVWRTLAFRCSLYGTALLARAVKAHAARARARRFHMFNNSASAHGKRTRILPCACLPDAPSCARLSSSALWSPRTHTLCPRGSRLGGDLAEGTGHRYRWRPHGQLSALEVFVLLVAHCMTRLKVSISSSSTST